MKLFKLSKPLGFLISVLLILMISIVSINALIKFSIYTSKVSPNMELTTDRLKFFVKNEIKREWLEQSALNPVNDNDSQLKTFRIMADQEDLDKLNENLPESGKTQYFEAYMKISDDPGGIRKVKFRYRGDTNIHWLNEQKSLRIKLNKNPYNLSLKFNLLNPPEHKTLFVDSINYGFSKKMGILSPDYYPCRVFLNSKYMGVYSYLDQVDESLLRKNKRMPGSIYAGDGAPLDNKNVSTLWKDEKYWKKVSSRNHEEKENRSDIIYFVNSINNTNDVDYYKFVNDFIDDKYFQYIAYENIVGGYHHDYDHNHKIYFDPYKGKFEPIQWDLRNWKGKEQLEKDISYYPLLHRIKMNPMLEEKRDKTLYSMLGDFNVESVCKKINKINNSIYRDLLSQGSRDNAITPKILDMKVISIPYSLNEMINEPNILCSKLKERNKYLFELMNTSDVKYVVRNSQTSISELIFRVDGNSPVNIELTDFFNASLESDIYEDLNLNGKIDLEDRLVNKTNQTIYPGRKKIPRLKYMFLGPYKTANAPLYYAYLSEEKFDGSQQTFTAVNTITNKSIKVIYSDFKLNINDSDSIHPWVLPAVQHKIVTLKERIIVDRDIIFDNKTVVNIEDGTTFLMDENASIYFYGKVTALGTKEKPIKFVAKNPNKPWGIVAVQGPATTGSIFEYVEFENGSIDTRNLIHYTSPFNIHDMDWFEVRHCKIGKNYVGDDSMHIAYAKGIVDSCDFHDARSDGLDIDISDVSITNNIFYNSGNDGLDVMTTEMRASNNIFMNTGDKGISVGEWSKATVTDSLFLQTMIGLEIKDKSRVKADNLLFIDSGKKAINLYNKNKRYDEGGFLSAEKIYLFGNNKITADKKSSVKIDTKIENKLPEFTDFKWYGSSQSEPYRKMINAVELKYAH